MGAPDGWATRPHPPLAAALAAALGALIFLGRNSRSTAAALITNPASFRPRASQHCLRWRLVEDELSSRAGGAAGTAPHPELFTARGRPLCRRVVEGGDARAGGYHGAMNCSLGGDDATHHTVQVGYLGGGAAAPLGSRPCVFENGVAAERSSDGQRTLVHAGARQIEVAIMDPGCDVWWRHATADVLPPMPELALPFGADTGGEFFGLCMMERRGDDVGVAPRLGTMFMSGDSVGDCVVPGFGRLVGGAYYLVQARESTGECVDDTAERRRLAVRLKALLQTYLTAADRARVSDVAGCPFAMLESAVLHDLNSCELTLLLSSVRFIPHALNEQGLTILRHLLAVCAAWLPLPANPSRTRARSAS
jgi:hypothetical protein